MTHKLRVEEASLNAWPALQQVLNDGWILRFSQGYTKRANSVNILFPSTIALKTKIEACEVFYAQHDQPAIFRLTSLTAPEGMDRILERRGYTRIDPTRVMVLDLDGIKTELGSGLELQADTLGTWLPVFSRMHSTGLEKEGLHRQLLEAILTATIFATLRQGDQVMACGLGVLEAGLVGLFDLITSPDQRRRGYGTSLLRGILMSAQAQGATQAYLQVTKNNTAAQSLYKKEGFTDLYHYWYRVGS